MNDTKRKNLIDSEKQLKRIVGNDPNNFFSKHGYPRSKDVEAVADLLDTRKSILDSMFRATEGDLERFRRVNDTLLDLTNQMYRRSCDLYRLILANKDKMFDHDYEVKGSLKIEVNYGENENYGDVLHLEDDNYYSSDFNYMIALIGLSEEYQYHEFGRNIEDVRIIHRENFISLSTDEELDCVNRLDDGTTWAEGSLRNPVFENIVICHAIHSICTHHPYSILDLLRINCFWIDVKLTCQHITDYNGQRKFE
jgi:hypothetical protein